MSKYDPKNPSDLDFGPKKATEQPKASDFPKHDSLDPKDPYDHNFDHVTGQGQAYNKDFDKEYKSTWTGKAPEPAPKPVPTPLKDSLVPKLDPDKGRTPVITRQPVGQHVKEGEIASFSVEAHGSPAPMYQWMLGIDDLKENAGQTGVKTATLTLSPVELKSTGQIYKVRVFNVHGEVLSTAVGLSVSGFPV